MADVYDKCLEKWGLKLQLVVLTEECGELIHKVSKWIRGIELHDWKTYPTGVAEEIADVEIMIEQVKRARPDIVYEIEQYKKDKLKRVGKWLDE